MPGVGPAPRSGAPSLTGGESRRSIPWGLPEWFAIIQVAGPAILFLPGTQAFRVPLRIAVFAVSLAGLVSCLRRRRVSRTHPAWILLAIAAAYMTLMILHPTTNTVKVGLAQIGMHLAVAAPIFWAPRYFWGDYRRLARMITILWIFNGASAAVGILQVRDPATWMPAEFSSAMANAKIKISSYGYRASDGRMVIRPPGLGDSPGAACGAGMFVATMGIAYLGLPVSNLRRLLGPIMSAVGVTVILLTHVRSSLVVVIGSAVVYSIILVVQRRLGTALLLAGAVVACGVGSILYASSLGGQSTVDRFASLIESDPLTVYERSARLGMVTNTFDTLMMEHPLGAGLGRWGMMRVYFGDEMNFLSPQIWAEVQFAAWVLDGGFVLLGLYLLAIALAVHRLLRLSLGRHSPLLRQWGAVIIVLSAGPIALMFSFTPFNAQMGMQFWLLIGAFEGVAQSEAGVRGPGLPG